MEAIIFVLVAMPTTAYLIAAVVVAHQAKGRVL